MILKQKLKQKINLALSTHRFPNALFGGLERKLNGITRQQKMRKGKGCTYVRLSQGRAMLRNIKETGAYLSVSRSTVYRLIQEGKLQRVYLRGAPRITEKSLSRLAGELDG